MEQCPAHEIMVKELTDQRIILTKIDKDIEYLKSKIDDKIVTYDEHLKESIAVRDTVKECKQFCSGTAKVLWIMVTAMIGLILKLIGDVFGK